MLRCGSVTGFPSAVHCAQRALQSRAVQCLTLAFFYDQEGLPLGGHLFQKLEPAREAAKDNPHALVLAFDWFTLPYKDQRTGQWKKLPDRGKDGQLQVSVIKKFVVFRTVVRGRVHSNSPDDFLNLFSRASRRTGNAMKSLSRTSNAASTRFCRRAGLIATGW